MKFLYENFLQFYLLALTSIIQHFYIFSNFLNINFIIKNLIKHLWDKMW
ncbi:hypothetical protein [Spiroplasma endosymbiont of Nomada rufipes]